MGNEIANYFHVDTSTPEGLRALDVLIAQELGYRFERPTWMDERNTTIYHPELGLMYHQSGGWTAVFDWEQLYDAIPNYSADLNAAMRLIDPTKRALFKLCANPHLNSDNRWCATLDDAPNGKWTCNDSTPALAICGVWLMWKQRELQAVQP